MTRKTTFFVGWSWFKFNNLGLAIGTKLKFYSSLSKGLKLKVRKSWGLTLTFVEVTGEKLVGLAFLPPPPPILNRVKVLPVYFNKLSFKSRHPFIHQMNEAYFPLNSLWKRWWYRQWLSNNELLPCRRRSK